MEELADLTDELCSILSALEKQYKLVYKLAENKQDAVVDNDIDELMKVVEKEEKLMEKIDSLEDKRQEITDRLSSLTGEEEFNLSTLCEYISGQQHDRVAELQERLQRLLEDLSWLNEQNRELLLEAMKFNEFSLKLLLKGTAEDQTYSPDSGEKQNGTQVRNIIDHRA